MKEKLFLITCKIYIRVCSTEILKQAIISLDAASHLAILKFLYELNIGILPKM